MSGSRSIALGCLSIAALIGLSAWQPFAPAIVPGRLVFPILGDQRNSGDTIRFEVGGEATGFEFRYWVRGQGDWVVESDWSSSSAFEFSPPVRANYAFQVDVRLTGAAEPCRKHWIGMTMVGPTPVDAPICSQVRVTPSIGDLGARRQVVLEATLGPRTLIDRLEMRLSADGREILGWRPWPREPLTLPDLDGSRVRCDVRLTDDPDRVEAHALGRMRTTPEDDSPDILRLIAAGRRGRSVPELAVTLLADRVLSVSECFLTQFDGPLGDADVARAVVERLRRRGWSADPDLGCTSPTGHHLRLRRDPLLAQWDSDPLWIDLSLARHDAIRSLLESTRDLDEEARLAALVGYFVFRAYDYAEDAPQRMRSISEPLGQCATTTGLLIDLLRALGMDVRVITLDNRGAAHALAWTRHALRDDLVIDTSEGAVFQWSPTAAAQVPVPRAITFPGHRSLGLDLRVAFDPRVTIVRSAERFEPVLPRQLERSSMRVEFQPR